MSTSEQTPWFRTVDDACGETLLISSAEHLVFPDVYAKDDRISGDLHVTEEGFYFIGFPKAEKSALTLQALLGGAAAAAIMKLPIRFLWALLLSIAVLYVINRLLEPVLSKKDRGTMRQRREAASKLSPQEAAKSLSPSISLRSGALTSLEFSRNIRRTWMLAVGLHDIEYRWIFRGLRSEQMDQLAQFAAKQGWPVK